MLRISTRAWLMSATALALAIAATPASARQTNLPAATAPVVQDQEPSVSALDEVVVTGSRIRRLDTPNPVLTLGREMLEDSSYVTVGDLVQQIPNVAGAGMTPGENAYGGTGMSTVSLRGLGSDRTLTLVDGIRFYSGDVNVLPSNMLERVEVLKDGASAVYGSDAVAGVVNFIARRPFDGVEAGAYYGSSDKGDAATQSFDVTVGRTWDGGGIVAGANYAKQEAILQSDRDWSNTPSALSYGEIVFEGSATSPRGRYTVSRSAAAALNPALNCTNAGNVNADFVYLTRIEGASGTKASDFKCFVGSGANNDTFNYAGETQLLTPQERYSLFVNANHDLGAGVKVYGRALYTRTESNSTIASDPFQTAAYGVKVSGASVYNPFGVDLPDLRLRLSSNGQRVRSYDRDDFQVTLGFQGRLADRFDWDVNHTFSRQDMTASKGGSIYLPAIQAALGPSFYDVNGVARCGTPGAVIANCTPVNFFGVPTREQLVTVSPVLTNVYEGRQHDFNANIAGDLFNLPAGPVGAAFGVEYRDQRSSFRPDFLLANRLVDVQREAPSAGGYHVAEAYGEINVPILADQPFAYALNFNAGVRYSDYSTFGDTTNAKYGIEYRPLRELLFRATYADVFRAPTIDDLFAGQSGDTPTVVDPCSGAGAGVGRCTDVPVGFVGEKQPPATNGSNPGLLPETGEAISLGAVWTPAFYTPLTVSLDFWRYKIEDAVGAPGAQTILDLCYRSGLPEYCALVSRNTRGEITNINNTLANIGGVETQGFDFSARWRKDTRWGMLSANLDATYLDRFDSTPVADQPNTEVGYAGQWKDSAAGGEGNFARLRTLASLRWSQGDWSVTANHRFISHVYVNNLDKGAAANCNGSKDAVSTPQGTVLCRYTIPSFNYVDLSASYDWAPANARFTVGVNNLFDEEMGRIAQDFRTYDVIGRFLYARLQIRFN